MYSSYSTYICMYVYVYKQNTRFPCFAFKMLNIYKIEMLHTIQFANCANALKLFINQTDARA